MFAFFVCLPHKGGAWRVSVSESVSQDECCVSSRFLSVFHTGMMLGVFASLRKMFVCFRFLACLSASQERCLVCFISESVSRGECYVFFRFFECLPQKEGT